MRQVKCANCGRTQDIRTLPDIQARSMTPFERRRQRWFYLVGLDIVLCGGSLRTDGIDDGHDWCLHTHRENHPEAYKCVETVARNMLQIQPMPEGTKVTY